MPQCKIVSHEGDGLYIVELQQDWSILDRKIADLTTMIDALTPQIAAAENAYNPLEAEYAALIAAQEAAMAVLVDINADYPDREDERDAATSAVVEATNAAQAKRPALQIAHDKWQVLKAKKLQYENKKTAYAANPRENARVNAQAVDKIDGTASEFFTGNYPVIAPNTFVDVYQLARESDTPKWYIPSALVHNESELPVLISPIVLPSDINGRIMADDLIEDGAQFWNCALLPGFQRWDPHIRRGILEAKAGLTFTVRFSPLASSVDLPLQGETDTFDFPLDYFCGPTAFQVNDAVIVKIDSWTGGTPTGTVIGFADGPARECEYSPGTPGEYLFSWPKFSLPLGAIEEWPDIFTSDILLIVYEAEPGDTFEPDEYDLVATSITGYHTYFKFANTESIVIKESIIVRDENYPTVPDHPGTGSRTYTSGGFSATVPRRILTAALPAPTIYRGETSVEFGEPYQYLESYVFLNTSWARDPDIKTISVTSVDAVNDILTVPSHGWTAGTMVRSTANSGGLTTFTQYYVGNAGADTLSMHTTEADALAGSNKVNLSSPMSTSITENGPEESRVYNRGYQLRRSSDVVAPLTNMGPNWSFEGVGEYSTFTNVVSYPALLESLFATDNVSFIASMNTAEHGVFTREYSIYRFPTNQGAGSTVEFWCTGDPDVYV